jgi:formylglycine-generating enzyme required for sulfatase activity
MAAVADLIDTLGYSPPDLYTFIPLVERDAIPSYGVERDSIPPYAIARYPVTNAQYARFLMPENFANKDLWVGFPKYAEPEKKYEKIGDWGEDGWDWLKSEKDRLENGVLYPTLWRDARFGIGRPNAPVVRVTWYEANAYCKWLLANWDELEEGQQGLAKPAEIRLPTEKEWVLAAGGEANDRFAFGELQNAEEEITCHANTAESRIQRTTPVWMYPNGASPLEVMDMSGNVFEWQANYYDKDHNSTAWRGGCWSNVPDVARVSSRLRFNPSSRNYLLGFRVVLAPHP